MGMAALLALFPPVGHDQLWCLYVAQRMLAGAKLYGPELFESNPPLIMWASLLLAHVAQLTHLPITVLFKLAVTGLEFASTLICLNLLRRIYPDFTKTTPWLSTFVYVVIFAVMPARDFGQRDHLLAVLCLPYVLAAALDASQQYAVPHISLLRCGNAATRVLIGLLAAIGICLKPHNGLLVLTTEALLLAFAHKRKLLRPELLSILATGALYLLAVRTLTPDYLTQVVPLLKDVYWAIGHLSPLQLIGESIQLHVLLSITLVLFFRNGWQRNQPATFFLAAGIASTIAYYVQGTGWYYQQIPALSFTAAALLLAFLHWKFTANHPKFVPGRKIFMGDPRGEALVALYDRLPSAKTSAIALSLLALGLTAHFTGYPFLPTHSFPIEAPDESFFTNLAPNTPVAILTTSVDDTVMPTAKYHLLWAQRTNNLWILPALLRNESGPPPRHVIPPARLAELEALQHRFMVEDLNRWHPQLILINRCQDPKVQCQVIEDRHDDLLAWFNRDPAFRAAFAPYHYVESNGDFDAYRMVPTQ